MDCLDDLGTVDALEVDRRYPQVRVPKLSLDHNERNALMRHLDSVRVPELVQREAATDAASRRGVVQLLSGC